MPEDLRKPPSPDRLLFIQVTDTLRDKLIQKGWVTPFNADTLVRLIEEHYADEPAVPQGREPVAADLEKEFRYWWKETYGSPYFGAVPLVAVLLWTECVLARWGNLKGSLTSSPPADGEVAELVGEARYLVRELSDQADDLNPSLELFGLMNQAAANLARTAELLQQMEDLAADAVAGLRYIEESCGRLYGVGWDRVYGKADRLKPAHALPLPEVNND